MYWTAFRPERSGVCNDNESRRKAGHCVTASRTDRLQAFLGKGKRSAKSGSLSQVFSKCVGNGSARVRRCFSVRRNDGRVSRPALGSGAGRKSLGSSGRESRNPGVGHFAGGDVRRFLRRAQVRVLPQPTGRVAQLAEQSRCRQFPGGFNERQARGLSANDSENRYEG